MTLTAPDSLSEQIAHHLAERIIGAQLTECGRVQVQSFYALVFEFFILRARAMAGTAASCSWQPWPSGRPLICA